MHNNTQDTGYIILYYLILDKFRNLNVVYNASLVIIKHNIKQRFITHQKTTCLK